MFLLAPSAYHRLRFREGRRDAMVFQGGKEAIARDRGDRLAFTGVLCLADLLFTTQAAVAVALGFSLPALTAWRCWAIALYRKAREQAAATDSRHAGRGLALALAPGLRDCGWHSAHARVSSS